MRLADTDVRTLMYPFGTSLEVIPGAMTPLQAVCFWWMDRPIRAETATPDGVRVVLFEDTWSQHILVPTGHPELAPHLNAILATVASPNHREPDDRAHRERFFKENVGPSRWLMVIVDFEQEPARIVTALGYGHGRSPRGWIS